MAADPRFRRKIKYFCTQTKTRARTAQRLCNVASTGEGMEMIAHGDVLKS